MVHRTGGGEILVHSFRGGGAKFQGKEFCLVKILVHAIFRNEPTPLPPTRKFCPLPYMDLKRQFSNTGELGKAFFETCKLNPDPL